MNLSRQPVRAVLKCTAYTYREPRTLKIALNGHEVATYKLASPDAEVAISVELALSPGNNIISFISPEARLPTPVVYMHGVSAVTTVVLVLLTGLGVGAS